MSPATKDAEQRPTGTETRASQPTILAEIAGRVRVRANDEKAGAPVEVPR